MKKSAIPNIWGQRFCPFRKPKCKLPADSIFFYVMASGGLYSSIYITVYSPKDSIIKYRNILQTIQFSFHFSHHLQRLLTVSSSTNIRSKTDWLLLLQASTS